MATLNGTSAADTLTGGADDDLISGIEGNDSLDGGGGNDTLDGGIGDDKLDGGAGFDRMVGGAGDDLYYVTLGDDVIEAAGEGADRVIVSGDWSAPDGQAIEEIVDAGTGGFLSGNEFANHLIGSNAANGLSGGGGADTLDGGGGNDTLGGGAGADRMSGGTGDDRYSVDDAGDVIIENAGGGTDSVVASISYTLPANVENLRLIPGTLALSATGNSRANLIEGNIAANQLFGGDGNDTISGVIGSADTMSGEGGDDVYIVANVGDQVFEAVGGGNDQLNCLVSWTAATGQEIETMIAAGSRQVNLTGNEFGNTLIGNVEWANVLTGMGGNDSLFGNGRDDTLDGGDGNDTLNGGTGADRMTGGNGNDLYLIDDADDRVFESGGGGSDSVRASVSWVLAGGQSIERLTAMDAEAIDLTGNEFDNRIDGNSGANVLTGLSGSDTLNGGGGNDHLYGQSANGGGDDGDLLNGGDGSDYLQGNAGDDTLDGGDGSDRINGGSDDDIIHGAAGNDTINGNRGDDDIQSDAGNDSLRGGRGNDTIVGGEGDDILAGDLGVDSLTGGAGSDVFQFSGSAALFAGASADIVTDFQDAIDRIQLGYAVNAVLTGAAQSSFSNAATLAQQLFDSNAGTNEVAAIQVGSSTYLFYSSNNGISADSAVELLGISAGAISAADFV